MRILSALGVLPILIASLRSVTFCQLDAAFPSLVYPHSVASSGLGEQGVASPNAIGAMQYNPANLIHARGLEMSFFRNPWNLLGWGIPLTSFAAAGRIGEAGSIGVEYTDWDFGDIFISSPQFPDGDGTQYHDYERSFAAGYAMPVNDQFAVGAQLRYAWRPVPQKDKIDHLLLSAGVFYRPEALSGRLHLGLSLMNFGTAIEYGRSVDTINGQAVTFVQADPPPAQFNIGLEGLAVSNEFFDLSVDLAATKTLVKRNGAPDYSAQSSFAALFSDWNDFPNDMTARIGLGYLWHPVSLVGGVSFLQEMYVGYFTVGPKDFPNCFYTHGVKVGVGAHGVTAFVGYAGRWHNNRFTSYLPWGFPWETFQFGLSTDMAVFGMKKEEPSADNHLKGVILSAGYSFGLVVGKMKETPVYWTTVSFSNSNSWSIEADFYVNENSAVLTSLHYARMTRSLNIPFVVDDNLETGAIESGFRYHPLEAFHPLFVQGSLGIIRMNPVFENTSPRYYYNTFDRLVAGCVVPAWDSGVILMPRIGMTTIFMSEYTNPNRLGGYNQVEFGVNAGYRL